MCMDGIKLLAKNEKELESDTNNKNIQPVHRLKFSIGKCAMLIIKSEKSKNTEGIELSS